MKILVVYYSFEGNTKYIAEGIAEATNADLLELKPKKEMRSRGFSKFVWGGAQVYMQKKPELLPYDKNPQDYDVIFIGTPVWAWTLTPVIRSFLSNANINGKRIGLFSCHGGQAGKSFENMKELLPNNTFIGEIDFMEALKIEREKNLEKAKEWAKKVLDS